MPDAATMEATVYVLVDDCGQCTAGDVESELYDVHESKGGYTALQLYAITLTLPRPRGMVELNVTLPADAQPDAPVTLTITPSPSDRTEER